MAAESAITESASVELELPNRAEAIESIGSIVNAMRDVRDKVAPGHVLANLTAYAVTLSDKQTAKEWVRSANLSHTFTFICCLLLACKAIEVIIVHACDGQACS